MSPRAPHLTRTSVITVRFFIVDVRLWTTLARGMHLLFIGPTGTPNTGDTRTAAPRRLASGLTLHLEMLEIGMVDDRRSDMMLRHRVTHHPRKLRNDALHLVDLVDERRRLARLPVACL